MHITELDSSNLDDAVKFNDQLNPRLWDDREHLRPEVRERLLEIAQDFREFLGVTDLAIRDITISGSNAAYTYTPNSDIDLHLVVNMPEDPVYRELFAAKKFQYNEQHDITIGGADVELYVQDADQPHISQGVYSLSNNDWVQVPRRVKSVVDDTSTRNKFEKVGRQIESAILSGNLKRMIRLAEKIKRMRQTGLENHGEFGPENLAFKMLRSQGLIKQLHDARNSARDKEFSLKEKAVAPRITYGFHTPAVVEAAPVEEPAASPQSDEEILTDFIDFCFKELELESMPVVKLRRDPEWSVRNRTFGRYIDDRDLLEVAWGQRHIMDVLRTVAHELTHRHQHERESVPGDAGETGSPYENEANARAGVLMRDYAALHPEYFAVGDTEEVDESVKGSVVAALSACIIGGGSLSGCATQQGMQPMDAARIIYNAKQYNSNVIRADVAQELNNFIRAQRGETNAQNSSRLYQLQRPQNESASGYIPTKRQARDPRYSMALTKDIRPGQLGREANKLKLKTNRQGVPQIANPNGLFEQLAEELDNFKQQDLFEINMGAKNLRREAAKTGALAGMEFEMYVPGPEDSGELEPDYDIDPRCSSIQEAYDFFNDGDHNSRRSCDAMRDSMQTDFQEWMNDRISSDWENHSEEYIADWVRDNVDDSEWRDNVDDDTTPEAAFDEFVSYIQAHPDSGYYQDARQEFSDNAQGDWDENDWLRVENLDRMSLVESAYSMTWPIWQAQDGNEVNIENVAQEFEKSVGRTTRASDRYHASGMTRPGTAPDRQFYLVEPDSSLDEPDSVNDRGLEFVSPPLPIDEMLSDLNRVKTWAKKIAGYTNDSTGLHINISVPNYSIDKLDFVKLALLMGDNYVLDAFGRSSSSYAKSALDIIKDAVSRRPEDAARLLGKMKGNLDQLATKAIHSGITKKYTSINTGAGHIEFRSPGGDWLDQNFDQIENTLLRFTVAMSAALDPTAYRQEYLTKLYKLLSVDNKDVDTIKYFADYVAGKIPKQALRSFVKQAQLTRQVKRGETGNKQMWWQVSNPAHSGGSVEVVARSQEEAIEKALQPPHGYPDWANTRQTIVAEPLRPLESPPPILPSPATDHITNTNLLTPPSINQQWTGQWRVMIDGEEVWRFRGVDFHNAGNNQGDANRIARIWLQDQRDQGVLSPGDSAVIEVLPVMIESVTESSGSTLYFFDVGRGGRSFTDSQLKAMGLRQTKTGRWYYQPGGDATDLLTVDSLKHLEKTLNVMARAWQRPVAENFENGEPKFIKVNYADLMVKKAIQSLNREIFTDEWIDKSEDASKDMIWWIVKINEEVAGYCSLKKIEVDGQIGGYLARAGVLPAFRGHGLQQKMIGVRLAEAKKMGWPWVVTDTYKGNAASMASLKRMGFNEFKPNKSWIPPAWARDSKFWKINLVEPKS